MINTSLVHPLFDKVLSDFFQSKQPHEDIDRTVPPQARPTSNEDYLEFHESHEELGEKNNGGYGGGRF